MRKGDLEAEFWAGISYWGLTLFVGGSLCLAAVYWHYAGVSFEEPPRAQAIEKMLTEAWLAILGLACLAWVGLGAAAVGIVSPLLSSPREASPRGRA